MGQPNQLGTSSLLKKVDTVTIPAIPRFRANDHFQVGTSGPVKIGRIGDSFRQVFLVGDGKIEDAVAKTTLRVHKLTRGSTDSSIIAELGGEAVAETTLGQMYETMKAQSQGQQGILLTSGCGASIFYVRDSNNVLWAVNCDRPSGYDGWNVFAYPVMFPLEWDTGDQVFSR